MSYTYAYITGCAILFLFWLFMFIKRRDLRREMFWASLWGAPLGLIDFFLVPHYWNPDSLFGFIKKYGVGIESFVFLFVVSGIASVVYEFMNSKKPVRFGRGGSLHPWLICSVPAAFVVLAILFPEKAVYCLMAVGATGALITAYLRRDLRRQMFVSAFIFSFIYFGVFVVVNNIFPGLVEHSYNLENIWGIFVVGVPLEEIGVAFFAGAFWSTIYEYTKSYREKSLA